MFTPTSVHMSAHMSIHMSVHVSTRMPMQKILCGRLEGDFEWHRAPRDLRAGMHIDVCIDMCTDMRVDVCIDVCKGTCADMCAGHVHPNSLAREKRSNDKE